MDFDFDDLEQSEPALLAQVAPMSEGAFKRFRSRLEKAERERRFEDFAAAVAEAIWDEDTLAARMPKVVEAFQWLLDTVARRSPPDLEAGSAISWVLWQMSLSTSLHETRVRRSEDPSAPCVLITGFGGSDVQDLEAQAAWYHTQNFNVISTSRAGFPPLLRQKHDRIVARELGAALGNGAGLVLHLCSQYGVTYGADILWLWTGGIAPFDCLPSLRECLKAVVFDCAAPAQFDPVSNRILYPTDKASIEVMLGIRAAGTTTHAQADTGAEQGEAEETPLQKSEDRFYLQVLLGCTGALAKKLQLKSLEEMVPTNKDIRKCLLGGARYWRCQQPWVSKMDGAVGYGTPGDAFAALQLLDWGKDPPFPRLFLYSERDLLVTADRVKAWIRHVELYRPEAKIFEAQLTKATHCKNWEMEFEECAAAVLRLLADVGLPARR